MPKILRCLGFLFQATVWISLALLVPVLLSPDSIGLAAPPGGEFVGKDLSGIQPTKPSAAAVTDTFQNFDLLNAGTPYTTINYYLPTATLAARLPGGPTDKGRLMRLAFVDPHPNHNGIAFDRTNPGTPTHIVADFDFRITPGNGRADGLGFTLLNTSVPTYGTTGPVPLEPPYAAEEPNFIDSLGVGFDIYKSTDLMDINHNHVSIHFNTVRVKEFNAAPLDLAGGQWIHARVILRPGGGFSDVTVILTEYGGLSKTVINRFKVPGFTRYTGRVHFAARAGGLNGDHDIDNIHVQFLKPSQSVLAFSNGSYSILESGNKVPLTVTRVGSATGIITVTYATMNNTAKAGSDYTKVTGTLTFKNGEKQKTFSIPILDDKIGEGAESFLVALSNPTNGVDVVGGPAVAKVIIHDEERGVWGKVIPLPVVPIHMHLLPTGKVMFWDRHDHGMGHGWDGDPRLWNPATGGVTKAADPGYDLFCSGHSFMADGKLLITGGHDMLDFVGEEEASLYDPFNDSWEPVPDMNAGRWYPSNVTLANGDTLVMAGTITGGMVNTISQILSTDGESWRSLPGAPLGNFPDYPDFYPFLYLAPNGKIFNAGPQQGARYLDTSGNGSWTEVASSSILYRDYGSSVMYDEGKVLIVGGNPRPELNQPYPNPSSSAEVIDLKAVTPTWRSVASMHFGRRQHTATLLPDGKVLVTGGSSAPAPDDPSGAVLHAEMWDPKTEAWTLLAAQTRYRGYHSTALLLPDGRVLVGGGGHPDPLGGPQPNFEIYSPPYLFKGAQPKITGAPSQVGYNQVFFVETPNTAKIDRVTLIRLSSVTHAFNQNQRINHLKFSKANGILKVRTPANGRLAPPGHYMLFILDDKGVPSVARIIRLGGNKAPAAVDDAFTMAKNSTEVLPVLANDSDPDGAPLTIVSAGKPLSGTVTNNLTTLRYTPTLNIQGTDVFTYRVTDGALTDTATVTVTIIPVNDATYLPVISKEE